MSINITDIERMHRDGLISDEQRGALLDRYVRVPDPIIKSADRGLITFLSCLAAILIICGAAVLTVSHWQDITPFMKLCAGMVIMVLAWVGCLVWQTSKPGLSEALGLLGAGMWGVNLLLHEALFDSGMLPVETTAIFFAGIVVVPFLVPQRVLVGVVAITSVILYIMMLGTTPEMSWLSLNSLMESSPTTALMLLLCIGLFWWQFGEYNRRSEGVCRGYYWVSVPSFLSYILVLQYCLLYGGSIPIGVQGLVGWLVPVPVLLIFVLFKPKQVSWICQLSLGGYTALLLPLCFSLSHMDAYRDVAAVLLCSVYAALLMVLGTECRREAWINYSVLLLLCLGIKLMIVISQSLVDSGLVLITVGVSMLVFAYVLEVHRRRLVTKVKDLLQDK